MKKVRFFCVVALLGLFISEESVAMAAGGTTTICPGAGVTCKVTTTVDGKEITVTSEKDKDKGAVIYQQ